jgi:alpha-L-fucosidase 2
MSLQNPLNHEEPSGPNNSVTKLWYTQPASEWTEALPIGNGRLGAMVFGGLDRERLQLNEDTLWAGGPYNPVNPQAATALPEVRRLIFAGEYQKAAELISAKVMATPLHQMPYETVGDLILDFGDASPAKDYHRELDLDTAIATTRFSRGGVRFVRETFVTPVDQLVIIRLTADRPGSISFAASFNTPQQAQVQTPTPNTLALAGRNGTVEGIEGELTFEARVHANATDGIVNTANGQLHVRNADAVTLHIAMATSYKRFDDCTGDPTTATTQTLSKACTKSYEALKADHIASHQKWFRRVSINLGTTPAALQPTDQRIANSAQQNDPALAALYFQYARYLLICSSRPGSQPANLQGIWNDSTSPPWGSKYTININTQMNYWPAEPLNLPECVEPLIAMVKDLAVTGARTAKEMYGAGGWVCHHNTDLWRATAPIDGPNWGIWPTGGAWLCKHLFDHYEFGGDRNYLEQIYQVMKGAAQFFLDTLVEEPTHKWLVTCPSLSPENKHPHGTAVCAGPTMDSQIIRDLFDNCISAANVFQIDADFRRQLAAARDRLPPNQIGSAGQLQEWLDDWDTQAPEQEHRHVSHLYGLFPSAQIDPRLTPQLAEACRNTLNTRGDITTGWAIAWRINLWARLLDAQRAHRILKLLFDPSRTYPNMFDAHPPFQIDGNFGGASGITEMLVQSHSGEIHLLPALPSAWPSGSVTGLRARERFEIDITWRDGNLTKATLRSTGGQGIQVRYKNRTASFRVQVGVQIEINGELAEIGRKK